MSAQSDSLSEVGVGGSLNWLIGGAVGGIVGSLLFGVLLWFVDPEIVAGSIPAIYGIDPAGIVGWALHAVHGLVLGIVFGFVVTRELILGALAADVETEFLAAMGIELRLALAGLVYGLAIWAILPLVVLPIWLGVAGIDDPGFPVAAVETLVGHLAFGALLGALFSVFAETDSEVEQADDPFEEPS